MITVERLRHGGIMANYRCTAACRHCLYACSPDRSEGYISKPEAESIGKLLRDGGCRSAHIGGGEPFLDFERLLELIRTVTRAGITVEYIETNAFWAADEVQSRRYLKELKRSGADALCISLDPFHAEYVSPQLPIRLAEICNGTGFRFFLWQDKFTKMLSGIDKACSRAELERLISPGYILKTAQNYGLHMGGRAINIEAEYAAVKPAENIINARPCRNLLSSGHFHVDLYGRFIPPGCTGIAIPLDEAVNGIPDGKYPVLEVLLSGGVAGLLAYAKNLGFRESSGYTSGCALCFHIRHWLSEHAECPELFAEHYKESLKYY
ncbi:MAG: 4Fe-4S cluster-binding domain-containing protein [Defluviitaleaceae bacterium]|nr:4Fe-4S cluster-binding domain-containing protein [Defluviitaleaceae bacterium]MCL2836204.1 4Fe-4S cluster-binding domain-containing protein [Defluviitaleaceae bacterium]